MKTVTFVSAGGLLSNGFRDLHTDAWELLAGEDALQHWEMQSDSFNNITPLG